VCVVIKMAGESIPPDSMPTNGKGSKLDSEGFNSLYEDDNDVYYENGMDSSVSLLNGGSGGALEGTQVSPHHHGGNGLTNNYTPGGDPQNNRQNGNNNNNNNNINNGRHSRKSAGSSSTSSANKNVRGEGGNGKDIIPFQKTVVVSLDPNTSGVVSSLVTLRSCWLLWLLWPLFWVMLII
jgi:hypothetical protein